MTFAKGKLCELRVLQGTEHEVKTWTDGVMAGLTTQHLFTGSFPMRTLDVKEQWEKERKEGDILFGIWIPNERFIGTCGLYSHRDIYRSWEARWLIFDPNAVGKGIGQEAVKLLTRYAFWRLNAHRVWLGVSEDNLRAVKCYLDCGYRIEGRQRDEIYYGGEYHSTLRMSVLESERQCLEA